MSSVPILLAAAPTTALPEHPGVLESLEFQAVGLLIVMGALVALYLLCAALGRAFQALERLSAAPKRPATTEAEAAAGEEAATPTEEEIPIAVIAAAVAAVLDHPHRLVRVSPTSLGWSLEGRRQLLTSHQLRH